MPSYKLLNTDVDMQWSALEVKPANLERKDYLDILEVHHAVPARESESARARERERE